MKTVSIILALVASTVFANPFELDKRATITSTSTLTSTKTSTRTSTTTTTTSAANYGSYGNYGMHISLSISGDGL